MKRIIICTLLGIVLFTSCGPGKFVSGLNKLDVGMTKQEVISVLGRNYKKWGIEATPEGNIERWAFQDNNILYYSPDEQVIVSFLNDRLIEWHKEVLPQPQPQQTTKIKN